MDGEHLVTQLLRRYNHGERAVANEIIPLLYEDLRRLAHQRLRRESPGHTLGTTGLVNEFYMRLVENRRLAAQDRDDFLAIASQTMRRLLVDHARSRRRLKRGGDQAHVSIEEAGFFFSDREAEEVLALNEALEKLRLADDRAATVVELRFFGGLSLEDTAQVLGISAKTVQRTWLAARAWLRTEIRGLAWPPNTEKGAEQEG